MKTLEIASLPLDFLEETLRKNSTQVDRHRRSTKKRVGRVLERNFRECAILGKAAAIWELMCDHNINAMLDKEGKAMEELWIEHAGKQLSPFAIIETLNLFAHRIHMDLLKKGYAYENLTCEPEVKGKLYEMAESASDMKVMLAEVAAKCRSGKYKSTESIAHDVLIKLGTHYWAAHVVESYKQINSN